MLLLGIDAGTSSIKVTVLDAQTQRVITSAQYPKTESPIQSPQPGWAEQDPEMWWQHVQQAILKANASMLYDPKDISAIGIAYQMHGLVMVDKDQNVLRPSIIWCDSRAVSIGDKAFHSIGEEKCLSHLLNSPGNFTAAKLAWVKANEPHIYEQADKIILPGDYIAMMLTGELTTSIAALSEGIFWDFKENSLSKEVMEYFGFNEGLFPVIKPVFSPHGLLKDDIANALSLKAGIPVSYKAGDQPNNALALNVMEPGEVATTAGTAGIIYGVSNALGFDKQSRVNSFAHVNHTDKEKRIGVLLCINGAGIANNWTKKLIGADKTYASANTAAGNIAIGSNGLLILPFGNGAERMLNNKIIGAQYSGIDFNTHTDAHIFRALQEGIAFALRYGLDIMRENGMQPSVIRAGKANMFLSDILIEAFVNTLNVPLELYSYDGSAGAAIGAGIGAGIYSNAKDFFGETKPLKTVTPDENKIAAYEECYAKWKDLLEKFL